jgi:hypothetical protein
VIAAAAYKNSAYREPSWAFIGLDVALPIERAATTGALPRRTGGILEQDNCRLSPVPLDPADVLH